jgi:hypothetical protein
MERRRRTLTFRVDADAQQGVSHFDRAYLFRLFVLTVRAVVVVVMGKEQMHQQQAADGQ